MDVARVPDRAVHDQLARMEGLDSSAAHGVVEVHLLALGAVLVGEGRRQREGEARGLSDHGLVVVGLGQGRAPPPARVLRRLDGRAVDPRAPSEGQGPGVGVPVRGRGLADRDVRVAEQALQCLLPLQVGVRVGGAFPGGARGGGGAAFLLVPDAGLAEVPEPVGRRDLDGRGELEGVALLDRLDEDARPNGPVVRRVGRYVDVLVYDQMAAVGDDQSVEQEQRLAGLQKVDGGGDVVGARRSVWGVFRDHAGRSPVGKTKHRSVHPVEVNATAG